MAEVSGSSFMVDNRLINVEPLPHILSITPVLFVNPTCTRNYDPKWDMHVLKRSAYLLRALVRSEVLEVRPAYYDGWFFCKVVGPDVLVCTLLLSRTRVTISRRPIINMLLQAIRGLTE